MKFSENLKYLRKESGLTQEKLAEKLNVSRQAVAKWENGDAMPDAENLKEISYLFGVSTDQLLENKKGKGNTYFQKSLNSLILNLVYVCAWVIGMVIFTMVSAIQSDNETIVVILMITLLINLILIGLFTKNYVNTRRIINMQDTKEAKKERRKIVIKDTILIFIILFVSQLPMLVGNFKNSILIAFCTPLVTATAFMVNFGIMENNVVKYNSK